jgi:hypothetical protein
VIAETVDHLPLTSYHLLLTQLETPTSFIPQSSYFAARYSSAMKKINFSKDVLPHAIAIGVFLIVTLFFFNPYSLTIKF